MIEEVNKQKSHITEYNETKIRDNDRYKKI